MANCQIFLNALAHQYPDTVTIVLMDNGSCHTAKALVVPANMGCLFLPPYSPELNPIERLWQDVKAQLAWVLPPRIEALEVRVETIIRQYAPATIQALTSYPYFVQAVNALQS